MDRELKIDDQFTPYPIAEGDELFEKDFLAFNITKMLEYIKNNYVVFPIDEIDVDDYAHDSIDESHLDSVNIAQPVIYAERSPRLYTLIDGKHRMEKARRLGLDSVPAYMLRVEQHIQFMISKKAYLTFAEYWNKKLKASASRKRRTPKNNP